MVPPPNAQRGSGAVLSFSVSFTSDKSYVTAQVANELVDRIMVEAEEIITSRLASTLSA